MKFAAVALGACGRISTPRDCPIAYRLTSAIVEAETFRFAKMAFAARKRDEQFSVIERIHERTDSLFDDHLAFFHLAL